MCGIAGILYKKEIPELSAGDALIRMLDGCQHRGPDSTGFALYRESREGMLRLRFFVDADDTTGNIDRIESLFKEHNAEIIEKEFEGSTVRYLIKYEGDVQRLAYAMENAAKLASIGTSLDIIKDIGSAHDVDEQYHVNNYQGSHGLGHVRLATESDVKPEAAHPFWATGFADVAIVHNGQITNYWKMRRQLQQRDFEFHTDNDSELVAVYIADKLSQGISLRDALKESIDDLDGTFSFLVSTKNEIGYAKDRLAVKPMILYENDDLIAVASEEVSLNRLFPGQALETREPPPGTFNTWQL